MRALSLLLLPLSVWAMQIDPDQPLISPIVNKPFTADMIRIAKGSLLDEGPTDMGSDSDTCRHTSGISEYFHYIITDPHTYFSAIHTEWDAHGVFKGYLPPGFKEWITSKDGFFGDLVVAKENAWRRYQQDQNRAGKPVEPKERWCIPQKDIPVEAKYARALICYAKRGARDSLLAKVALSAAWALRCKAQKPIAGLDEAVKEINELLAKKVASAKVDFQKTYNVQFFYECYRDIFGDAGLSNDGYLICGLAYYGFALRIGYFQEAEEILNKLGKRFEDKPEETNFRRALVRHLRKNALPEYQTYLRQAAEHFMKAMAAEEFPRPQLIDKVFIVGECFRRSGDLARAADWYIALGRMDETMEQSRREIRAKGKVPSSTEAPTAMLLAWRAEDILLEMTNTRGLKHPGNDYVGPDRKLLDAIVLGRLGTLEYKSDWKPRTGGTRGECEAFLRETGLAVMQYEKLAGEWPQTLGEMWLLQVVRDRDLLNRFHCPVTGMPFAYLQQIGPNLPPDTVLVCTSAPLTTEAGGQYGAFTTSLKVVWSDSELKPGQKAPATTPNRKDP